MDDKGIYHYLVQLDCKQVDHMPWWTLKRGHGSCAAVRRVTPYVLLLDEVLDGQVSKLLTPQGWYRILCEFLRTWFPQKSAMKHACFESKVVSLQYVKKKSTATLIFPILKKYCINNWFDHMPWLKPTESESRKLAHVRKMFWLNWEEHRKNWFVNSLCNVTYVFYCEKTRLIVQIESTLTLSFVQY